MRLNSLEIQGFKSFPDKIKLNFTKGVTVIIGPNGSGKSNIADAIKWVLGELSLKSIRGVKMEDVIFGGADTRRQLNSAEVSLTFDNTADPEYGRLNTEYNEVIVTRRYFRNGESEYLINDRQARLKDVTELFMNTGIGHSSYAIIGQGKIAEILSQKSEERRNIFEEAAGIAKYRYKKNEAERKLSSAEENIVRITDILAEVGSRADSLKTEAERAQRYLEVYELKKRADVSLFLYDLDILRNAAKESDDKLKLCGHELEIADDSIKSYENKSESLYAEEQENKLKYERCDRRLREYGVKINGLNSDILVYKNDILHISKEIEKQETELAVKRRALDDAKQKSAALYNSHSELDEKLQKLTAAHDKACAECTELEIRLDEIKNDIKNQNSVFNEMKNEQIKNQLLYVSLETKNRSYKESYAERLSETEELISLNGALKSRVGEQSDSLKKTEEELNTLKKESSKQKSLLSDVTAEKAKLVSVVNEKKSEAQSLYQRSETLKRMEEHFDGYAASVKFIMNCVEKGLLSGSEIIGPVSKVIKTPRRYITAIETAVGGNIQNIITSDDTAVKKAIGLLKENNAGRVTFYPLASMQPQPMNFDAAGIQNRAGYIGAASELAEYDIKYKNIVEYMLGRTLVFDCIENAAAAAKAYSYRVRIVTLDGQLINAGGSFTGGSVKQSSGILSRSEDIANIEAAAEKLETEIRELENAINKLAASAVASQEKTDAINNKLSELGEKYQAETARMSVIQAQYDDNENKINKLKTASDELFAEINKNLSEYRNALENIDSIKEAATGKESEIKSLEAEQTRRADILSEKISRKNDLIVKLVSLRKDIEISANNVKLNEETIKADEAQISMLEQYNYSYNEQIIELRNKIENGEAASAALSEDCLKLQSELEASREKSAVYDKGSEEIKARLRELTRVRENLLREYTGTEAKSNQYVSEQDKLITKLWDDHELTYSTAAAAARELNYPEVNETNRAKTVSAQSAAKAKLREIGPVNVNAIEEYKEASARREFLSAQVSDLNVSKASLREIINKLSGEMRERFLAAMKEINNTFNSVFRELFGGGSAELILTSPGDPLESGIDINIAPPGKIIKNLSLLSGGEQAFVATALLFALLKINPAPFCVLDEIEATLDELNVVKFADYCKKYSDKTQFIIITHRRRTMEAADMLYGITMYEKGISKILSLNLKEAAEKIGVSS